jgi:hypothetical protein
VRFDFDVTNCAALTVVSFEMTVIYSSDNTAFNDLRSGTDRFSLFQIFNTLIGNTVALGLDTDVTGSGTLSFRYSKTEPSMSSPVMRSYMNWFQ